MQKLVGTSDAAAILGISRATVVRHAALGLLEYETKLPGRLGGYLFNPDALQKLAAEAGAK